MVCQWHLSSHISPIIWFSDGPQDDCNRNKNPISPKLWLFGMRGLSTRLSLSWLFDFFGKESRLHLSEMLLKTQSKDSMWPTCSLHLKYTTEPPCLAQVSSVRCEHSNLIIGVSPKLLYLTGMVVGEISLSVYWNRDTKCKCQSSLLNSRWAIFCCSIFFSCQKSSIAGSMTEALSEIALSRYYIKAISSNDPYNSGARCFSKTFHWIGIAARLQNTMYPFLSQSLFEQHPCLSSFNSTHAECMWLGFTLDRRSLKSSQIVLFHLPPSKHIWSRMMALSLSKNHIYI